MRPRLLTILLIVLSSIALAQENASQDSVIESRNDSLDLASDFYKLYRVENSPAYDLYESWDNHNPAYKYGDSLVKKTDFFPGLDSTLFILTDSMMGFSPPVNQDILTSGFGRRYYRFHYGTDIDLMTGDSVRAVFDGRVRYAGYYRGYGHTLVIRHYNGLETLYAHLSGMEVDTNDYVCAGDLIGYGGSSGRSTGSHLHFETRYLGAAFDSERIIDYDHFQLRDDSLWLHANDFAYLGPVRDRQNAKYHVIRKGDTLSRIARMYHTSIRMLCRINRISRSAVLQIGRKLRVR